MNLKIIRNDGSILSIIDTTTDSGAVFIIDKWSDGRLFSPYDIQSVDIEFPNAEKIDKIGEEIICEPVKFLSIPIKKTQEEKIVVQLPLGTVQQANPIDIGSSSDPVMFKFAFIADQHFGEGTGDFDINGWNTQWSGSIGSGGVYNAIMQNLAVRDKLILDFQNDPSILFVFSVGDLTQSAERAEFECARELFVNPLIAYLPYLPLIGNHDLWPYNGGEAEINSSFPIGKYFLDYLFCYGGSSSLLSKLKRSFPNFSLGPHLNTSTDVYVWKDNVYRPTYLIFYSFDYQNVRFICADFNTREHAHLWFKGTYCSAEIYWNESWRWFWSKVREARKLKKNIVILAHNPLRRYIRLDWDMAFTFSEMRIFKDSLFQVAASLNLQYEPFKTWLYGHLHQHLPDDEWAYIDNTWIAYNCGVKQTYEGWYRYAYVRSPILIDFNYTFDNTSDRT